MKILALDASSLSHGSIALVEAGRGVISALTFPSGRREGGSIFANVEIASKEYGPADRILVGLGPGSYSGIRQSIALAQGLQMAWQCPLAGLASACGVSPERQYQVFGDARRGSYYFTRVFNGVPVDGPRLIDSTELTELFSAEIPSYAAEALPQFPQVPLRLPSAVQLATVALGSWAKIAAAPVEPFYLREPNITEAKDAPRLPEA